MIFGGIRHQVDFGFGEPLAQTQVGTHDGSAIGVVMLTPALQPHIVVSRRHLQHGFVDIGIKLRQFFGRVHHRMHMVAPMAGIKAVVARHDFGF